MRSLSSMTMTPASQHTPSITGLPQCCSAQARTDLHSVIRGSSPAERLLSHLLSDPNALQHHHHASLADAVVLSWRSKRGTVGAHASELGYVSKEAHIYTHTQPSSYSSLESICNLISPLLRFGINHPLYAGISSVKTLFFKSSPTYTFTRCTAIEFSTHGAHGLVTNVHNQAFSNITETLLKMSSVISTTSRFFNWEISALGQFVLFFFSSTKSTYCSTGLIILMNSCVLSFYFPGNSTRSGGSAHCSVWR